jgi:hypothetical protein
MHFSTILITALAAAVLAGPTMKRQAACPEVDNIPACGVSYVPFYQEARPSTASGRH